MSAKHKKKSPAKKPVPRGSDRSPAVLAGALALLVVSSLVMMPFIPDDSYISFRYAEHLANGEGLTFNVGEPPVEAYSNFLWILVCAFVYKLGFDLPGAMPYVGLLTAALCLVVMWVLYRRRGLPPLQMLLPMLLLATSGPFVMYAVSGLEAPLFGLLMLSAVLFVDRVYESFRLGPWLGVAAVGVLLALCRPEGAIAFPLVTAFVVWETRRELKDSSRLRNAGAAVAFFAVCLVIYSAWRVHYFGEWLPTPLLSKGGGGAGVWEGWLGNINNYFVKQGFESPAIGYYFVALFLVAIIGILRSAILPWQRSAERLAVVVAVVYSLVYFNFVDWMPGMRYHVVLVGLLLLPVAHVQNVFFAGAERERSRQSWLRFAGAVAAAVLVSTSILADLKKGGKLLEDGNVDCLIPLGKWLREVVPPGGLLAMSDVGAAPYYSRMRTLDIHTESLTDLHIAQYDFSVDYILGRRPDVVALVSRGVYAAKMAPFHFALASAPAFGDYYRFVGTIRHHWYQERSYWIMFRNTIPPLSDAQLRRFPPGMGNMRRMGREVK
jgi:hypothetical protein